MAIKIRTILSAVVIVAAFFGCNILFNSPVNAAEDHPIVLQISPVKQKLSLQPGEKYSGTFKVMNVGTQEFEYSVSATPYSVSNDNYDANYDNISTYSQISKWVTFDKNTKSGKLAAGTSVDVKYTVDVPTDVPSGGQYAALMAQTESGNDKNANIQVVHRVGMILYATVPGDTREEGEIINNTINTIFFNPPLSVSSLVKNTGNVEMEAKYTVNMWPLFDKETVYSNAESPKILDIIPETSRYSEISWEGAPKLGVFIAEQKIEFAGQTSYKKHLVVLCPIWLLFIVIALVFFMVFWIISNIKNRKTNRKSNKEE